MVPRNDVVSVPVQATLDHILSAMAEHQFSRLPVYEGRPENIIGFSTSKIFCRSGGNGSGRTTGTGHRDHSGSRGSFASRSSFRRPSPYLSCSATSVRRTPIWRW